MSKYFLCVLITSIAAAFLILPTCAKNDGSLLGDPNNDGRTDAKDATFILSAYSDFSTGGTGNLSETEFAAADVKKDGKIDANDASAILAYYAYLSTGGKESIEAFIASVSETTTGPIIIETTTTVVSTKPDIELTVDVQPFRSFSDYTAWAESTGYPEGLLQADGNSGLNQDYFHTPVASEAYSSGCIVIGDSRCCQLGIYQSRTGRNDFAAFAVWGGHYTSGFGGIMTESHLSDVEECFRKQIENCGKCTIFIFATVNDYDCYNNNNSAYIRSVVAAAERISSLSYEYNGKEYRPEIIVIGFDGCWITGDLFGIPHETFNQFVSDYNDSLESAVNESDLLRDSLSEFTTVPLITEGDTGFIDDGLHYSDDTLGMITEYILNKN
ncbi:MAG: hypothetical protein J6Y71_04135 [Ruminococcus sp.]|nr:hypothetical protein [Ruminococcus sp.]